MKKEKTGFDGNDGKLVLRGSWLSGFADKKLVSEIVRSHRLLMTKA
jgi:hypothetical protein